MPNTTKLVFNPVSGEFDTVVDVVGRDKVASGSNDHVIINSGAGALTSEAQLAISRGGTNLTALGSALQVIRVNAGATALEYSAAGSGDVSGPASATAGRVAVYNGATGKIIQDGTKIEADLVTLTATETLTNKTLTSPVINSPTGIVKGDVGLGNVDNTSDATKNAATATLTGKTIDADDNTITNIEDADIKAGAAIARSKVASGSNDHVIINSGAGALSSEAQLAGTRGGTGISSTATFPASGVVVTRDAAETLTSKTLTAPVLGGSSPTPPANHIALSSSAAANRLRILGENGFPADLFTGNLTAGRTLTLPNVSTTLVGRSTSDTLTNKTIDADDNTITNIPAANIVGRVDGVAPAAGRIGESISAALTVQTLTRATSGTVYANITSAGLVLTAGRWQIFLFDDFNRSAFGAASSSAYGGLRIRNTTDSTTVAESPFGMYASNVAGDNEATFAAHSSIHGIVDITSSKTFEAQLSNVWNGASGFSVVNRAIGAFYAKRIA